MHSCIYEYIHVKIQAEESFPFLPVVVPEFDVSPRLQNLPILQPGELRLRLALCLAGENSSGADRPSNGLWSLNKLCWSWKMRGIESQICWFPQPRGTDSKIRAGKCLSKECQQAKEEENKAKVTWNRNTERESNREWESQDMRACRVSGSFKTTKVRLYMCGSNTAQSL